MVRRTGYIRLLLALYLFALILSPRPAAAADPLPGDACSAGENAINTFQWNTTGDNGTPSAAGVTNAIFCIGNVRKSMMNFQAATGYVGIGNTAPGSMLDVGKAGTTLGTLRLEGSTSGYVQIQPAAAAGSWTATLPATAGTSGYVLSTDGTGITSWISNAGTASTALSSITAAGHTIANANFAQVWNWDTLTTGTALKLASTSMTTGNVLYVTNTNSAAVNGATVYVNNSQTGSTSDGIDDKLDRADGPAAIERKNGSVAEYWWKDGKLHRVGGPAIIVRDATSGTVMGKAWWEGGEPVAPSAKVSAAWLQKEARENAARIAAPPAPAPR